MKKKLIGIFIGVMMLVTILPITALATTTISEPQTTTSGLFDRTTVRGYVVYQGTSNHGKRHGFLAWIWLRKNYLTITFLSYFFIDFKSSLYHLLI